MRLLSWVQPRESSVGSATIVANRVIKLQSITVVVRHHQPKTTIAAGYSMAIEALKRKKKSLVLEH